MIYLNNAQTTIAKSETIKTAKPASFMETKKKTAAFFSVGDEQKVFFTGSGREAVEIALRSILKEGDHVVSTDLEHEDVTSVLDNLKAYGIETDYVKTDHRGVLDYQALEQAIRPETRALVVTMASNLIGNVTDMEKVTAIARRHGVLVISDGRQAAGAMDICLKDLGIDVFCFTAHKKMMGPTGLGGICLKETLDVDFQDQTGLESPLPLDNVGEEILGKFCAAMDFIKEKGIYGISVFPHRLAKRFFESVQSMDKVTVYGDFGTGIRIPTVTIKVEGFTGEEVKLHMRKNGITVKDGNCGALRLCEDLNVDPKDITRFSFGYFNTRREVNDAIWVLMDLLGLDDLYLLA